MIALVYCMSLLATVEDDVRFPADLRAALQSPTEVTVYALAGSERLSPPDPRKEYLQRTLVLGKATLPARSQASATARAEFRASIPNGMGGGMSSACFDPHYGMRVKAGTRVYDILLCYDCYGARIYVDNKALAWFPARGKPAGLNRLYQSLNIPVPPSLNLP